MDFLVEWSDGGLLDLETVLRDAARRNPDHAASLRDQLLESVAVLRRFPFIGPVYERDATGRTREILCRNHRIFYRVDEPATRIFIMVVQHAARREPPLHRFN